MSKIAMVMEGVWLVLAGFCLMLGIHSSINIGLSKSYMFFVLTAVAILMYFLRRHKRRQFSNNTNS